MAAAAAGAGRGRAVSVVAGSARSVAAGGADSAAQPAGLGTVEQCAGGANHLARPAEGATRLAPRAKYRVSPRQPPPPRSQWFVPPRGASVFRFLRGGQGIGRRALGSQRHLAVTPSVTDAGASPGLPQRRPQSLVARAPRAFPWPLKTRIDPGIPHLIWESLQHFPGLGCGIVREGWT